jgi:apolipoprotein N-acyltransferase
MSINIALFFVVKHYPSNKRMMNIGITAANVLLFLPLIYGIIRLGSVAATNTKAVTVGIVQPNLDPYDKWAGNNAAEITAGLLSDAGKLAAQDVDLIIFPETAIPVYFNSGAAVGIRDSVFGFINRRSIPILTGVADLQIYPPGSAMPPDVKFAPGADFYYTTYNGIYVIQPGAGVTQRYGKMKLVPFGEHVPFVDQIPMLGDLMRWSVGIGGWNIGKDTTVMNVYSKRLNDTVRIGGVVCYESIYGDLVARFTARGAQLLAVVTNDSWYGNTSGPYQHRDFAKLRAVENRRYVVRCANGGISCAIDPLGEIVNQSKMYEHTTMRMAVIPRNEITFFVRHPLLISHLCVFITLWFLGLALLLSIKQMLERYRPKGNHQLEGTE